MTSIYIASRFYHAPTWQEWRAQGVPLISSWIDTVPDESIDGRARQWERNVSEISTAAGIVLYCQPGEVLKGVLVEVGIALTANKPIACVGVCDATDASPHNATYAFHPLWKTFSSLADAFGFYGIQVPSTLPMPKAPPALKL